MDLDKSNRNIGKMYQIFKESAVGWATLKIGGSDRPLLDSVDRENAVCAIKEIL